MEIISILGDADVVKICQIKDTQLSRSCATYGWISCQKDLEWI